MTSDSSASSTSKDQPTPRLPLFYRRPRPLSSVEHASWRLKTHDYRFAAQTAFVPIVIAEIASSAHDYPVVFAADSAAPLALTGLEGNNLFVQDGAWATGAYVPAYVRRYPFGFLATDDGQRFILALDVDAAGVVSNGDEGRPLFADGKPSELTNQALAFCDAFQNEAAATTAFATALKSSGLLIDRRADVILPDGRKLGVDGFQIVDAEKFAALDGDIVLKWHRKGWLALIHFHLASLDRFSALMERQAAWGASSPSTEVSASKPGADRVSTRSR